VLLFLAGLLGSSFSVWPRRLKMLRALVLRMSGTLHGHLFKACNISLNAALKGLLFKAQIKGFKLIANKYRILRLGNSIYLMLN